VAAAGPATRFQDCVVVRERQRLDLTLTKRRCTLGVYLDQANRSRGQATSCYLTGTYVAQETSALDVDLLSPSFSRFPQGPRHYRATALVGQVW